MIVPKSAVLTCAVRLTDRAYAAAHWRKINYFYAAGRFKRLLTRSPGHKLVKELYSSRRTGDLKGNRPAVRLGHRREPKKPAASPFGVNDLRDLG